MATTKKIEPVKMTPTQMKKKIEALEEEIRVYKEDTAWCYMLSLIHISEPTRP